MKCEQTVTGADHARHRKNSSIVRETFTSDRGRWCHKICICTPRVKNQTKRVLLLKTHKPASRSDENRKLEEQPSPAF